MRLIAYGRLRDYWRRHPETEAALIRWFDLVSDAEWHTIDEVVRGVGGSKALNGTRVRFAIHGGDYRLIAAFDFQRSVIYVKFLGTHAEYERVDALTIAQF